MVAIAEPQPVPSLPTNRRRNIGVALGAVAAVRAVAGHLALPLFLVVRGVPFLGLVLLRPDEAGLAIGGAQASAGRLPWVPLVVVSIISAVSADVLKYALGRTVGEAALAKLTSHRHGRRMSGMVDRSRRLVDRHGVVAVAAARPTIVGHGVVPILAGIGKLHPARFVAAATVGAVVWVGAWLGGAALVVNVVRQGRGGLVVGVAAVTLAVGAVLYRSRRFGRAGSPDSEGVDATPAATG